MLASDMRAVLCSTIGANGSAQTGIRYHNNSASCDALLNLGSWTMDKFLKSFSDSTFSDLLNPSARTKLAQDGSDIPPSLLDLHQHMLGKTSGTFAGSQNVMQRSDEDYLLWSGEKAPAWVACNQRNKTCYGKLSKEQWYSKDKPDHCKRAFAEQVKQGLVNSTAVGIDICNLNNKMDSMCKVGWRRACVRSRAGDDILFGRFSRRLSARCLRATAYLLACARPNFSYTRLACTPQPTRTLCGAPWCRSTKCSSRCVHVFWTGDYTGWCACNSCLR